MDIGVDDERDTGLILRLGYSGQTGGPVGHRRRQTYLYMKSEASVTERLPPGPSLTLGLWDAPDCQSADDEHAAELQNSSPSSAVSASFCNMKKEAEAGGSEETEKLSSRGSDEEEEDGGARKKLRLTKEQSALLEDRFREHSTLNPKQKLALAKQLNLRPRQVEVWFQNRRARTKLKQTEADCEFLRRCCETLTDENRRLHRELQDLKALRLAKAAAPLYMQQLPAAPTTLTVCPSCERVVGGGDNKPKAAGAFSAAAAAAKKKTLFLNPFTGQERAASIH